MGKEEEGDVVGSDFVQDVQHFYIYIYQNSSFTQWFNPTAYSIARICSSFDCMCVCVCIYLHQILHWLGRRKCAFPTKL